MLKANRHSTTQPNVPLNKVQRHAEKVAPTKHRLETVCVLCSQNCGLVVDVDDNRIVKVIADKNNPITQGYSCNKAYSIDHYVNHKQRVQTPLKRQADGQYRAISWDLAVTEIAQKLNGIKASHGAQALALCGIGGQANHMDAFFGLGFLQLLGTTWFFNSYAQEKTQHQWVDGLMMQSPASDWFHPDAWNSDYILMMGTNPLLSNRHERATKNIKEFVSKDHKQLVVVDPRVSETARRAHIHLRVKPAADAYLLLAMIKIIIEQQWYDKESLSKQTKNFNQIQTIFLDLSLEALIAKTGITAHEIEHVSKGFANAERACVFFDLGVEQIEHSTLVSWLIRVLILMTGNFAKPGGQYMISNFIPSALRDTSKPVPVAPVSGIEGIAALTSQPMFSPYLIPEEIEAGNIRGLIVEGANPLLSYGDSRRYKAALESLDILVVIDPAMTETARVADYILPTPVAYEKWEQCTFPRGFPDITFQLRPPVVSGPKDTLPEAEIYFRLASAMKILPRAPVALKWLAKRSRGNRLMYAVTLLMCSVIKGRGDSHKVSPYAGFWCYETLGPTLNSPVLSSVWLNCLAFAMLRRKDMLRVLGSKYRWKSPFAMARITYRRIINNPQGLAVARLNPINNFQHAVRNHDKKIDLLPKPILELFNLTLKKSHLASEVTTEQRSKNQYPLLLCAGERTGWNANTIHRTPVWRKGKGPHCWIKINPITAATLNLTEGERVRLVTAQGEIVSPLKITDTILPGVLSAPHGFGIEYPNAQTGVLETVGQNLNRLTSLDQRDPITGVPYLKHQRCRLEKISVTDDVKACESDLNL